MFNSQLTVNGIYVWSGLGKVLHGNYMLLYVPRLVEKMHNLLIFLWKIVA